MRINRDQINVSNKELLDAHKENLTQFSKKHRNLEQIIDTIAKYNIAIPSWALGAGGTRFGRFGFGGEPGNLEQKLEDVAVINDLMRSVNVGSKSSSWGSLESIFNDGKKFAAEDWEILYVKMKSSSVKSMVSIQFDLIA